MENKWEYRGLAIAQKELQNGKIDRTGRREFRARYSGERAYYFLLGTIFIEFNSYEMDLEKQGAFIARLQSHFSSLKNVTKKIVASEPKMDGENPFQTAEDYGRAMVEQLYYIYYTLGLQAAMDFLKNVFFPTYEDFYKRMLASIQSYDGVE